MPICWLAGEKKKKTIVRWVVIFLNSETRNDDSEARCPIYVSRSLLSSRRDERVNHVSTIQFHYSWSGNAALAALFKENGWNQS